jgi:hypothetical protein
MPTEKRWGTGSTQDRQVPDEDPGRGVPHEAGPTGAAPESSELEGDRDANDETRNAQGGAMGGALAGMAVAGPIGSAVGAVVGWTAGAAAGIADDDSGDAPPVESPGRVIREPYGHQIEVDRPEENVGDRT